MECIPLYRPSHDLTVLADAAISAGQFVDLTSPLVTNGGTLASVGVAPAGSRGVGVAAFDAAEGETVAIIRGKGTILPVVAAVGCVTGDEVEIGAAGGVRPRVAGVVVGRAWSVANTGGTVYIELI